MTSTVFDYHTAFARNIGFLTEAEQQLLRGKRVAIAGLGGVGGIHLMTLARLGIGAFNIADADQFELINFNRQVGASMATLGQPKADVMTRMAHDINPEADIRTFPCRITEDNMDDFLRDADIYVDALDFFELEMRKKMFARCRELGIPAITAGPIGMSTAMIVFTNDSMSFEDYFRFGNLSPRQQIIRFMAGLTPKPTQFGYLVDSTRVNFDKGMGPSMGLACNLCAGFTAAEVLKLMTKRGKVYAAPYYQQIDAYKGKWVRGRLLFGNAGPLQRLKIKIISWKLDRLAKINQSA